MSGRCGRGSRLLKVDESTDYPVQRDPTESTKVNENFIEFGRKL